MNWQPIETAPKDGTDIVLYHRLWEGYVRHGCCRDGVWIAECGKTGWYAVGIPPSHWMPLPEPPDAK